MTGPEIKRFMGLLAGTWPQTQITPQMFAAWTDFLRDTDEVVAMAAYRRERAKGSAFTPSLAEFVAGIATVEQGPPPTAEQAERIAAKYAQRSGGPSWDHCTPTEYLEGRVRQLMDAGEHEAVCRWLVHVGPWEACTMPDAASGLERDSRIRLLELKRTYREQSVSAWQADPTPGLALEQAQRLALVGPVSSGPRRLGDALGELGAA